MKIPKKGRPGKRTKKFNMSFDTYVKFGTKRRHLKSGGYNERQLQLKRLIWLCGGVRRVMEKFDITRFTISRWIERESIPAKYFRGLSELTDDKMTVPMIAAVVIP